MDYGKLIGRKIVKRPIEFMHDEDPNDRQIARTFVRNRSGDLRCISTVALPFDHGGFAGEGERWFETMVFDAAFDHDDAYAGITDFRELRQDRCATYDEAIRQHIAAIAIVDAQLTEPRELIEDEA